jgi:DNA-binding MarR family transcriptional regulator
MAKSYRTSKPDPWGQRVVFLDNGAPVRRVPVSLSRRFFQICMTVAAEVAAEEGLTALQFGALTYLYDEPDIDQSGLTARLGIDRSNTSILVDELEEQGLVERTVGEDRRVRLLRLTARGIKMRDRLRPKAGVAQARILETLPPADRERFLDMLVQIVEANDAHARPGASRRKPGYRLARAGRKPKAKVQRPSQSKGRTP